MVSIQGVFHLRQLINVGGWQRGINRNDSVSSVLIRISLPTYLQWIPFLQTMLSDCPGKYCISPLSTFLPSVGHAKSCLLQLVCGDSLIYLSLPAYLMKFPIMCFLAELAIHIFACFSFTTVSKRLVALLKLCDKTCMLYYLGPKRNCITSRQDFRSFSLHLEGQQEACQKVVSHETNFTPIHSGLISQIINMCTRLKRTCSATFQF